MRAAKLVNKNFFLLIEATLISILSALTHNICFENFRGYIFYLAGSMFLSKAEKCKE